MPELSPQPVNRQSRSNCVLTRCAQGIVGIVVLLTLGAPQQTAQRDDFSRPPWLVFSPNWDFRPVNLKVTAVVVHATQIPTVEETVRHLTRPESHVSAHYVVGKRGEIMNLVPIDLRAWHAGVSELGGYRNVNDISVGIEMVNANDGLDPYPEKQVQAVSDIIRYLRRFYDIPLNRIVSHRSVARPVGRKDDPKGFDFRRLFALL